MDMSMNILPEQTSSTLRPPHYQNIGAYPDPLPIDRRGRASGAGARWWRIRRGGSPFQNWL
jgi:hypothetical protein